MRTRKKCIDLDEFLADYPEGDGHCNNPYDCIGTMSNVELRACRNNPKHNCRDGIGLTIISILWLGLISAIMWSTHETGGDWDILPLLILFFAFGTLMLFRGVTLTLGIASNLDVEKKAGNYSKIE
jgi:hypothetical protein